MSEGGGNLLKEALFGHFKLYCISLTVFSYFLNGRIFFLGYRLMYAKRIQLFLFEHRKSNCLDSVYNQSESESSRII